MKRYEIFVLGYRDERAATAAALVHFNNFTVSRFRGFLGGDVVVGLVLTIFVQEVDEPDVVSVRDALAMLSGNPATIAKSDTTLL